MEEYGSKRRDPSAERVARQLEAVAAVAAERLEDSPLVQLKQAPRRRSHATMAATPQLLLVGTRSLELHVGDHVFDVEGSAYDEDHCALIRPRLPARAMGELGVDAVDGLIAQERKSRVAKRRAEEGREAADVAGWRGALDGEWSRSVAAAAELRRRVGVASKWQAEQARVLSRQWAEGEAALARCLPEDAELIRPEKLEEGPLSCLVM